MRKQATTRPTATFLSQLVLVFLLIFGGSSLAGAAEAIRVMSFNIRYGKANDGENHWEKRKDFVVETIRDFEPDLLGTQETLKFQADFIAKKCPEFTYFGRSRMKSPNEHCGIFFRSARFTQLAGGHFWLSEQPQTPESKSWDSSLPRMATWVLLNDHENETGEPVLFLNTHFDHRGRVARLESAKLIRLRLESLKTLARNPLVVTTGDFNTAEASAPYEALLSDNKNLVDTFRHLNSERTKIEGTFNSWRGTKTGPRIDWILADSRFQIEKAEIVQTSKNGRFPSDHFPVTAVLKSTEVEK